MIMMLVMLCNARLWRLLWDRSSLDRPPPQLAGQILILVLEILDAGLESLDIPPPQLVLTRHVPTRRVCPRTRRALRLDLVAAHLAAVTALAGPGSGAGPGSTWRHVSVKSSLSGAVSVSC